jgi:hypothetical protein
VPKAIASDLSPSRPLWENQEWNVARQSSNWERPSAEPD